MQGSITLVTPPDVYENSNLSVLFIHLDDAGQDTVSRWLKTSTLAEDLNIYVYNGEANISWLLYALGRCDYKYINTDNVNAISQAILGYIVGKSGVCYETSDENIAAVYSHINSNRVKNVGEFLERALGDQTNQP
jgi:hypothetical protein